MCQKNNEYIGVNNSNFYFEYNNIVILTTTARLEKLYI